MHLAIFYPHDTPTFKTKALHLVSNERGLKGHLLLYKWIIQSDFSLLWLSLATNLANFHPYDTPTFKSTAIRLVSNNGRVKCLLLLYKRLIQPYLSFLWLLLVTHFVTRATLINDIDDKSYTTELKSHHNYSTNHMKPKSRH